MQVVPASRQAGSGLPRQLRVKRSNRGDTAGAARLSTGRRQALDAELPCRLSGRRVAASARSGLSDRCLYPARGGRMPLKEGIADEQSDCHGACPISWSGTTSCGLPRMRPGEPMLFLPSRSLPVAAPGDLRNFSRPGGRRACPGLTAKCGGACVPTHDLTPGSRRFDSAAVACAKHSDYLRIIIFL
jgi:hypothetical protein